MPFSTAKSIVAEKGFSLIELVVVIAILGILISISLPLFSSIRKEAQVRQMQNQLATIVKECVVALMRDKSTLFKDIQAAQANPSGFRLIGYDDSGNLVAGEQFLDLDCFTTIRSGSTTSSAVSIVAQSAVENDLPEFTITYMQSTSELAKKCYFSADTKHTVGCKQTLAPGFDDRRRPVDGEGVW